MTVKLEMGFENLDELRAFLEVRTGTCKCAAPVEQTIVSPEPVQETPKAEVPVTPPPQETPGEPVTAVPTTTPQESTTVSAPTVSTAAPSYTLDDLARAGTELVDAGRQTELPGLLQRFDVSSLPDLPQEKYAEFAAALREMGARI